MSKKLYELPRNTQLRINGQPVMFHHIDGMYSLCSTDEGIVHLAATIEMELQPDGVWEMTHAHSLQDAEPPTAAAPSA